MRVTVEDSLGRGEITIEESGSGRVKVENVEMWRMAGVDVSSTTPVPEL